MLSINFWVIFWIAISEIDYVTLTRGDTGLWIRSNFNILGYFLGLSAVKVGTSASPSTLLVGSQEYEGLYNNHMLTLYWDLTLPTEVIGGDHLIADLVYTLAKDLD